MSKETVVGRGRLDSDAGNLHDTKIDVVLTRMDCMNLVVTVRVDRERTTVTADDVHFQARLSIFTA